jgi:hypothetical protein
LPVSVTDEEINRVFSDRQHYGNSAILTKISISHDLNSRIKYAILEFESDISKLLIQHEILK